jgi:hypothetical protein
MRYVQYLDHAAKGPWNDYADKLIEACGDRSVVILDGRNGLSVSIADAHASNGVRRRHYPAFRIYQGPSELRSDPITDVILSPKV